VVFELEVYLLEVFGEAELRSEQLGVGIRQRLAEQDLDLGRRQSGLVVERGNGW
jgi:hypothetical protein